ncbi:MAG: hypothetical protein NTX87_17160 [Planctomycetota bacterium]|nr:hypothetical protein [Planctomycetota bacterium]
MSKSRKLKPGEPAPASGQYQVRGPRGGKGPQITGVKGKPLPPSRGPRMTYNLVDRTRHQGHRG